MNDFIDIGPECFANQEQTVISWRGENFYKACDVLVTGTVEGASSHCVKRIGHPGDIHEDFDGNTKGSEESPPEPYPFIVPQREVVVECLNERCRRSRQLRRASLPQIGNELYLCGPIMCTCGDMVKIWENPDAVR